jgi:hypothetical protein
MKQPNKSMGNNAKLERKYFFQLGVNISWLYFLQTPNYFCHGEMKYYTIIISMTLHCQISRNRAQDLLQVLKVVTTKLDTLIWKGT